jgi:hypothetical protein
MSFHQDHQVKGGLVPIMDELSPNMNEYVEVNQQQLCRNANFFDNDPNVKTGFNFRMDALLNGGIIFKRKKHKMSTAMHDFMSAEFTTFLREVVRNWWYAGYCAVIWHQHDKFVGKPDCLNLTQIRTLRPRSIFHSNQKKFRYFYQPQNGKTAELEIHNVMTFIRDGPDQSGNLRSLIGLLQQDQIHEDMIQYYSLIAMKGRAMPIMVTEKEKKQYDHDSIKAPTARAYADIYGDQQEEEDSNIQDHLVTRQTQAFYGNNQPTMTGVFAQNASILQDMPFFSSTYQLTEGRKFVSAPRPEGPEAYLLLFRVARQERAYALMGVPLAMVSNSSSTSHSKLQTQNSNSFVLFDNSQQSLKLELIAVAKTMFYSIHLAAFAAEYRESTPPKERNPQGEAEECEITVEMPSIPDENKLVEYYNAGWLLYEVLVAYLASRHGISMDSWHLKPQLNLREANDIDPPEKAKAPAKKKK